MRPQCNAHSKYPETANEPHETWEIQFNVTSMGFSRIQGGLNLKVFEDCLPLEGTTKLAAASWQNSPKLCSQEKKLGNYLRP